MPGSHFLDSAMAFLTQNGTLNLSGGRPAHAACAYRGPRGRALTARRVPKLRRRRQRSAAMPNLAGKHRPAQPDRAPTRALTGRRPIERQSPGRRRVHTWMRRSGRPLKGAVRIRRTEAAERENPSQKHGDGQKRFTTNDLAGQDESSCQGDDSKPQRRSPRNSCTSRPGLNLPMRLISHCSRIPECSSTRARTVSPRYSRS